MSNSSSPDRRNTDSSGSSETSDTDSGPLLARRLRVASFWLAIVLPFVYLPLLVVGLTNAVRTGAFLGFLALNLLALYFGHAHRQRGASRDR